MSTVRYTIQGKAHDYEAFSMLGKRAAEAVETNEPGTLAYEWFAHEVSGRFLVHELYEDGDAFLRHFENVQATGVMDEFMRLTDIDAVTVLNRVTDDRVNEALMAFDPIMLHGMAGMTR